MRVTHNQIMSPRAAWECLPLSQFTQINQERDGNLTRANERSSRRIQHFAAGKKKRVNDLLRNVKPLRFVCPRNPRKHLHFWHLVGALI